MEDTAISQPYVNLAPGITASDYALKNLNKALGLAQIEFIPAVKNEENKYGGYKYTPLSAIVSAFRPALTKQHLTLSQIPTTDLENKTVTVYSRLVHWDSGEWIQTELELPAELALGKGGTPVFNQQTIGGSQTYAQKYACKGILVIPDAEEMIDSTEEKGDLPARAKAQRGPKEGPLVVNSQPTEEDERMWVEAFNEALTLEDWNKLIVPMMKERADNPRYGRKFIVAVAATAKNRGYKVDRTTGLYTDSNPLAGAMDRIEQQAKERDYQPKGKTAIPPKVEQTYEQWAEGRAK